MTNLEKIQNMSIDEMAEFLNNLGCADNSPWIQWGDSNFCKKCSVGCLYSPCELSEKCPFNMGLDVDWCKEWLKAEVK